jgi:hypothetical protein
VNEIIQTPFLPIGCYLDSRPMKHSGGRDCVREEMSLAPDRRETGQPCEQRFDADLPILQSNYAYIESFWWLDAPLFPHGMASLLSSSTMARCLPNPPRSSGLFSNVRPLTAKVCPRQPTLRSPRAVNLVCCVVSSLAEGAPPMTQCSTYCTEPGHWIFRKHTQISPAHFLDNGI